MNHAPTVEQFLAEQSTEYDVELETVDPLESIAESLRTIAAGMGGETFTAELAAQDDVESAGHQEYDDLYEKYNELFGVVADIEKIVKTSTSKVSLSVKDVIEAWRKPEVPAEPEAEVVAPAHDADVEQWREYARACGVPLDEPDAIDSMNRSQIRTMLGIEQPTA